MAYDYTKASDLAKWCEEQLAKKTKYRLGGIGRYENGVRIFDCIGMIKCFIWKDYSSSNARYYGKTCPDWNCEQFFNNVKVKGKISTIPEIPGIIVYMPGHVGVYMGNGVVIEATAAWNAKVQKSYFKGNHSGLKKRTSWTHWFKMDQLSYDEPKPETPKEEVKVEEKPSTSLKFKVGDSVVVNGSLYKSSNAVSPVGSVKNRSTKITRVAIGAKHPYNTTGDLGWMDEASVKAATTAKSVDVLAREVIQGKWGNGAERKNRLTAAGYDYNAVQRRVNQLLS